MFHVEHKKTKKMESGLKIQKLNGYTTLMKDTDWEGRTVYYIGLLNLSDGTRFHRIKISKRDYEKLEKISQSCEEQQ